MAKSKIISLVIFFLGVTTMGLYAQNIPQTGKSKILIAYFSWSGHTREIATQIQQRVGGDLFEIVPATPYASDYQTCVQEAKRDLQRQARPPLKNHIENTEAYDVIFLGYPNWWSSIPMPVATFLEESKFQSKTVAPFCSHGGGGLGQSVSSIKKLLPQSKITEPLAIYNTGGSSLQDDVTTWLRKIGMEPK